jgi:lysophospholipase L1-like esterase
MRNLAASGATLADVREAQAETAVALRPDVVFVSAGANDVTAARRTRSVRDDVAAVVRTLRGASSDPLIVITGVPDMGSVPRVAQPLRWLVGRRAEQVDAAVRAEAARLDVALSRSPSARARPAATRLSSRPNGFTPTRGATRSGGRRSPPR